MKSTCKLVGKIGIFALLLTFIFVPVATHNVLAAEEGAQGNPGPAGTSTLSEAQLAALAAASLVGFALVASSLTDDDENPTAEHTPPAHVPAVPR